jgi:hypothetical protein
MAFEGEQDSSDIFIRQHRHQTPGCFERWKKVYYYKVRSFEKPIIAGQTWHLSEANSMIWKLLTQCDWIKTEIVIWMEYHEKMITVPRSMEWMRDLCGLVQMNVQEGECHAF